MQVRSSKRCAQLAHLLWQRCHDTGTVSAWCSSYHTVGSTMEGPRLGLTMRNTRIYYRYLLFFSTICLLQGQVVTGFVVPPKRAFRPNVALSLAADNAVEMGDVGIVLLAGGSGSRMKATMPKQFLSLRGVPVLHYSLDLFLERLPAFAKQNGFR